jgi:calcineurin-like phosphoesterase family protein
MVISLKIDKTQKYWITSDTHYGHKNICRGVTDWRSPDGSIPIESTRPFTSIEEMNDLIVNNINSVVRQDDWLIHLGDWSFGGFENIMKFRERFICQNIILVLGNHDHHIQNNKENIRDVFLGVCEYMVLTYDKKEIILFHYPITSWNGMGRGSIHLHGHTHLTGDNRFGVGRRMDVGIDGHPEFRPYDLVEDCIIPLRKRQVLSETEFKDHHTDKIINRR